MGIEIISGVMAASSDLNLMTLDRIEACTKGHGALNIAVCCIANSVAEDVKKGEDIRVKFADQTEIELDYVLRRAIDAARMAGADSANAALLSAVVLYMAGANAQAGVPAGSRKLGGMARIAAGVDRCGVAALPSIKRGNKVSGFAAVQAIYRAMEQGELTEIQGRNLPRGLGPIFGHGTLGEEVIIPQIVQNAAAIGTQAMLDAMSGAGMDPDPLSAALLGSAAALEIVHPDAWMPDECGGFYRGAAHPVGRVAVKTAGMPDKLHVWGTNQEVDTASLVGDVGLILKDIGGASLVGMVAMQDCLSIFKEPSCGLTQATRSYAHHGEDAMLALSVLVHCEFDEDRALAILSERGTHSLDPETAMMAMNTIARKAEQVKRGPVTNLMIRASEPVRAKALYKRAVKASQDLRQGKDLALVVQELDQERQRVVEKRASELMSQFSGKEVKIRLLKTYSRNMKGNLSRWWGLDGDADVEVVIDGQAHILKGLVSKVCHEVAIEDDPQKRELLFFGGRPLRELFLGGNNIINITVPVAVAAVLSHEDPGEISRKAQDAAYITAGIPGAKAKAEKVAVLARQIAAKMVEE